jgi:hypothetical protein
MSRDLPLLGGNRKSFDRLDLSDVGAGHSRFIGGDIIVELDPVTVGCVCPPNAFPSAFKEFFNSIDPKLNLPSLLGPAYADLPEAVSGEH